MASDDLPPEEDRSKEGDGKQRTFFTHSLILSPKEGLRNYLLAHVGRFLFQCVAGFSVLAVLSIFGFIFLKSSDFLFSSGGDNDNPQRAESVAEAAEFAGARLTDMFTSSRWVPEGGHGEGASPTPDETTPPTENELDVSGTTEEAKDTVVAEPTGAGFGMGAMLYGSLLVTFGAMAIAVPLGIAAAVVLSDMVPFAVRQVIKPVVELLAAIPSVALGFFALRIVSPWLTETFGFDSGRCGLNAAVILAFMAIPTIVSVAEDALSSLGRELREASYALGATRSETIVKVVIPAAHNGIIAAVVLGMMRAIGETMVVWMAAGNSFNFPVPWWDPQEVLGGFFESVRTLTASIAADMGEAPKGSLHRGALFTVGLVLLAFTFALNMLTESFAARFRREMGGQELAPRQPKSLAGRIFLALGGALHATGSRVWNVVWFVPSSLIRTVAGIGDAITERLGQRTLVYRRMAGNSLFTLSSYFSVLLLGGALLLVLGPILVRGVEAFCFRETVEHRLFLLNEFKRGDKDAVLAEYNKCLAVRQPAYDTLREFAWLQPEILLKEADESIDAMQHKIDARREQLLLSSDDSAAVSTGEVTLLDPSAEPITVDESLAAERQAEEDLLDDQEKATDRARRYFENACEAEEFEDVEKYVERLEELEDDYPIAGTPLIDVIEMGRAYRESTRGVDLMLRHEMTEVDPSLSYPKAYMELYNLVTGNGGNGGLYGPENRRDISHMPYESQYGVTHWSMAEVFNERIQTATVYPLRYDENGQLMLSIETSVPRRDIFEREDGTFKPLQDMIARIDTTLDGAIAPKLTFYGGYFTDKSTPGHYLGGIGPELLGTFLITAISVLLAMPLGVVAAAYLVEAAKENVVTRMIRMCINTLAGVPSIVFGLFGLAVIVGFFTGGDSVLAGSLTLTLLILPVVIRASEEAIRAVPTSLREASLGLGAGPVRCFFTVTLPCALPSILTGMILAMSRAAGETAPLLFTCAVAKGDFAGANFLWEPTPILSYGVYDMATGDRLAALVPYNEYGMVATLIILVLCLNFSAILLRGRLSRKLRGG